MSFPLQITMRDMPNSEFLKAKIEKKAHKLEQFFDKIISCRVVVEEAQKKKHNGKMYNVKIDLSVPGEDIFINKHKAENCYIALRDAFLAVERKLKSHTKKIRGEVKTHELPTHGKVVRLFPEEHFGFIQAFDGREFYFHRINVAYPDFDQLVIGTEVQFLEAFGDEGWQANRVSAGKHQIMESL